jgi:hypothetical protein
MGGKVDVCQSYRVHRQTTDWPKRRIMKEGVKELSDAYLDSAAEFSEMLKERTPGEIAYDSEVVAGLRRGLSISKALELAGEKYPDEALQWDDHTIVDIKDHYQYLMNHEDILSKLKSLSSKK